MIHFFQENAISQAEVQVYCQTGTWKSVAFVSLCSSLDYAVEFLPGGYRGYLTEQNRIFRQPFCLVVLGGETGTGKTEVLRALARAGEQTVDLEALAGHKGSVFGALGQSDRATAEQFRNELMAALKRLDPTRPIWVEDKAPALGRTGIPKPFWQQMQAAPCIRLTRPLAQRVERIRREYANLPAQALSTAIQRLTPRLGAEATEACLAALAKGRPDLVVQQLLCYYDPAYARQLAPRRIIWNLECGTDDPETLAPRVKAAYGENPMTPDGMTQTKNIHNSLHRLCGGRFTEM